MNALPETGSSATKSCLKSFHAPPRPDAPVVLILPHAGGSATFYYELSSDLSARANVLVAQYPGRQDRFREAPAESVEALTAPILAELQASLSRSTPVLVFGHSMGALIGFELALALESLNYAVQLFAASSRNAPHLTNSALNAKHSDQALVRELTDMGGTDPELFDFPELLESALRTLRADLRVVERYRPEPQRILSCTVLTLIGRDEKHVDADGAAAWSGYTRGEHRSVIMPGGHFYLAQPQQRAELAQQLSAALPGGPSLAASQSSPGHPPSGPASVAGKPRHERGKGLGSA